MTGWNYIIIGLSFFLLCLMVWNEIKRANRLRLIWRIIASVVTAVSFACIALPVTVKVSKTFDASKEAVLLTDGFNNDSLRIFLNNTGKQYPIYTTETDILNSAQSFKPKLISYPQIFSQPQENFSAIHVFGYGLKGDQLQELNNTPLVFHPSEIPAGITIINWQQKLTAGDKLRIQGKFNNNSSSEIKLVLSGLHTNLDSIVVPPNTNRIFQLTTIPKHIDRAVYNVAAIQKKETIEAEDIPVEVIQPKSIEILMLAVSPDFENKFLKNRLSQNGYAVTMRSRISKNKFQKEYVNTPAISLDQISASVLRKFGVLIADAAELASISRYELQTIQSEIENKGLGLIVKADNSVSSPSFYTKNTSLTKQVENNNRHTTLYLKSSGDTIPEFTVERPAYLRSGPGNQSLIHDKLSVFANSTIYGNGKIIVSTLENTYTLLLSGKYHDYDKIWSLLLNKAAKKFSSAETVMISPALPRLNESVRLSIQKNIDKLEPGQVGEEKIYLQQDLLLPFLHTGIYYPALKGWIPQIDMEGKTNWLYVFNKNDWNTVKVVNKLEATELYVLKNSTAINENNKVKKEVAVSVPVLYFFIIFTISSGFLWFEKKLS